MITLNLNRLYLTKNDCYKAGAELIPKGIMVHSTGANNPNLRRYVGPDDGRLGLNAAGNHWNQPKPDGIQKCVHGFIGKLADGSVATYQTLPWSMRGWHAGGRANDTHIGFEICEDALKDAEYFGKAYREAVELTAYLCGQFALDPAKDGIVICHCEGWERGIASNHSDVMNWFPKFGKNMNDFRKDVKSVLDRKEDNELLTLMKVSIDGGSTVSVASVMKDGLNYPNLREFAAILNYNVDYDPQAKVVKLNSKPV